MMRRNSRSIDREPRMPTEVRGEAQMEPRRGSNIIEQWPEESREAAQLVIDKYGEPHEATDSVLIWHKAGPWKRMEASREFSRHHFPAPHIDSVASFIDYRVPPDKVGELVKYDGSVVVEHTVGEVSARCHDEQANFLALNLMHDVVTGRRTVEQARQYYAKEFLDYRRKKPTPYMQELRFQLGAADSADPDERVLSDEELKRAVKEGEASARPGA
jgi:hypothetical protein